MSSACALEEFGAETTQKLLDQLMDEHFEKAQKDGEFIVSNCKECMSSEKPLFLLPTLTGNRQRDYEELKHFYSSLTRESVKHFHVPKEKEEKNVGDTFWTDKSFMISREVAEFFYEEKERARILEFEDNSEDESEPATGPFDYSLDEIWC